MTTTRLYNPRKEESSDKAVATTATTTVARKGFALRRVRTYNVQICLGNVGATTINIKNLSPPPFSSSYLSRRETWKSCSPRRRRRQRTVNFVTGEHIANFMAANHSSSVYYHESGIIPFKDRRVVLFSMA